MVVFGGSPVQFSRTGESFPLFYLAERIGSNLEAELRQVHDRMPRFAEVYKFALLGIMHES